MQVSVTMELLVLVGSRGVGVVYTVVEGCIIHDPALDGVVRAVVVGDLAGDGAFGRVADILPPQRDALPRALRRRQRVAGVALHSLGRQAHTWEALGGREDDAAVGVVMGLRFVLPHGGQLDAVDGLEFGQGLAERFCRQDGDFG